MAEYVWSIEDEGATGAVWSFVINVAADGRSVTVSRDEVWTSLADARTSTVAISFVDRAGGSDVNTGATWNDLARPVTFSWPDYGLEVDFHIFGRTTGIFPRSGVGLPSGQPESVTGGTEAARFEIGQNGTLRPLSAGQTDWIVEDRPEQKPAVPAIRYTTLSEVKVAMRAPTDPVARSWEDGDFDDLLTQAIRSAESQIDLYCGRTFDVAGDTATERVYRERAAAHTDTDDFVGTATVSENGVPIPADQFYTEPVNEVHTATFRGIHTPAGNPGAVPGYLVDPDYDTWWIPRDRPLMPLTVTARWGWDRVPDAVIFAAQLVSIRLWRRYDSSALGMVMTDYGATYIPRFDSDVEGQLSPYRLAKGM